MDDRLPRKIDILDRVRRIAVVKARQNPAVAFPDQYRIRIILMKLSCQFFLFNADDLFSPVSKQHRFQRKCPKHIDDHRNAFGFLRPGLQLKNSNLHLPHAPFAAVLRLYDSSMPD